MIPQLLTVRIRRPRRRALRFWVPVLPVLVILSPVLIVAALAVGVACLVYRVSPVRALGTGWRLLCAMPGTRVDVEHGRTAVLVTIR